jgi:hypothetical protein
MIFGIQIRVMGLVQMTANWVARGFQPPSPNNTSLTKRHLTGPHVASQSRMNSTVTFVLVVPSFINNAHKSYEYLPHTLGHADFVC